MRIIGFNNNFYVAILAGVFVVVLIAIALERFLTQVPMKCDVATEEIGNMSPRLLRM